MISLRPAEAHDINTVIAIFRRAISDMSARFIFQWDGWYPSEEMLRQDIENGHMHLVCQGREIIGAVVLNEQMDDQYEEGCWVCAEPAAVVHRLCIDPPYQHHGFGRQAMHLAELMLKEQGFKSLRLDAFSQNPYAIRLYDSLGYKRVGEADFREGLFYLFEKSL